MKLISRLLIASSLFVSGVFCCAQEALPGLKGFHRIVFVGDSITWLGGYVDNIETYVLIHDTNSTITFLNLGQSSETVSGLSEPGHAGGKYVRPDLHTRLASVLEKTHPDLVFADYGMNDGIYQPYDADRAQKFEDGMRWLHEVVVKSGAKIIHITPSPFDPVGCKRPLTADGAKGYMAPYTNYDDVLGQYSAWLVSQRTNGWDVVDIHTPMDQFLIEQRKSNSQYTFTRDGVHPNDVGQWLMARQILVHLGAPENVEKMGSVEPMLSVNPRGDELLALVRKQEQLLRSAWLSEAGHLYPGHPAGLPLPEAEKQAAEFEAQIRTLAMRAN